MLANELDIDPGSNLDSVNGLLVFLCAIYCRIVFIFLNYRDVAMRMY